MDLNKLTYNYFLILFSLIPISILVGSAVSLINILLIDLSFIILMIYKKDYYFLKNKTLIYLLILYIYLIFNSYISIDYSEGIIRNIGFIRIIIFFVAINYFFQNETFSKKIFKFWSIIILTVLIDVFIERFSGKNILGFSDPTNMDRVVSFFKDELIVGGYLNGFYLIIIGFLFNEIRDKKNYLIILLSIIFFISILLTGERSNTIRAFLGISIFLLFYKNLDFKKKIITFTAIMCLIFTLIFNLELLKQRFINQFIAKDTKNNYYYVLYNSGFEVFKNYKLFGVGNKNYRVETCKKINKNKNKNYRCLTHPHQIYFEFLSEHGLIGTIIILLIFYKLIFSKIFSTIREKNYIKIGSLIYLTLVFLPIIPSGAFFGDFAITIFAINLSLFYASDKQLNIFKKIESKI